MKIKFIIAVFSALICSCTNEMKTISEHCETIDLSELPSKETVLYSEVFSNMKFVPLESTEQSVFGEISKMYKTNDGDYIVFDVSSSIVLRFDKNGKFLNSIGNRGRGKGEYVSLVDICYNHFSNEVVLWDNPRHCLMFFDVDGHMKYTREIDWYLGAMEAVNRDCVALYVPDYSDENDNKKQNAKKCVIVDNNGKTIKEYGFCDYDMSAFSEVFFKKLYMSNGKTLCYPEYSPYIYKVTENGMKPEYLINFGEHELPSTWGKFDKDKFMAELNKESDYYYSFRFFESDEWYVLNTCNQRVINIVFVNKDNSKLFSGKYFTNDMTGISAYDIPKSFSSSISPLMIDKGNNIYFSQDPSYFAEAIQRLKNQEEIQKTNSYKGEKFEISDKDYNILLPLANSINPVLVVCELK